MTAINADPNDPDWMYRPILNGAFSGTCNNIDKDVIGTQEELEYTQQ